VGVGVGVEVCPIVGFGVGVAQLSFAHVWFLMSPHSQGTGTHLCPEHANSSKQSESEQHSYGVKVWFAASPQPVKRTQVLFLQAESFAHSLSEVQPMHEWFRQRVVAGHIVSLQQA